MNIPCDLINCTGCRSCENICFKSAIKCNRDQKGFLYPEINMDQCVHCGLCEAVCNYSNKNTGSYVELLKTRSVFGYKNNSDEIRKSSSSGGVFIALAESVLHNNGVVYGCVLNEEIEPVYRRAEKIDECFPMMGAKYVQSDLGTIFKDIEKDVRDKKQILFTGAPCQCQALKSYLKVRHISKNTILFVEFLCHGGPSPRFFKDYKNEIEKRYKGKIVKFIFRDKERTKNLPSSRGMRSWLKTKDGNIIDIYNEHYNNIFFELFKRNYVSRDCCYSCKYVGYDNRTGDISMADFWGCEKSYRDFFDKKGISLVLVNTKKGEELFYSIRHGAQVIEVERDKCLQTPLVHVAQKPENYDDFWNHYIQFGYQKTAPRFTRVFRIKKKYYDFRHTLKTFVLGE